jgi:hypothetical protein
MLGAVAAGAFGAAFDGSVLAGLPVRNHAWRCLLVALQALIGPGACANQGYDECKQVRDFHGVSLGDNQQ